MAGYLQEGGKGIGQADRRLLLGSLIPKTLEERQSLMPFCALASKHRAWLTVLARVLVEEGKEEGRKQGRREGERKEGREKGKKMGIWIDGSQFHLLGVSSETR